MPTGSGPFEFLPIGGATAPLYLLRYDDDGGAKSPRTETDVRRAAAGGEFTDIVLMSHGWNTDFVAALGLYRRWVAGLADDLAAHPLPAGRPFAPLFVGVLWPSTSFLFANEHGPEIAAGGLEDPQATAAEGAIQQAIVDDLAESVAPEDRARFFDLVDRQRLGAADATALAGLLEPLFAGGDADIGAPDGAQRTPGAIVAAARAMAAASGDAPERVDLDAFDDLDDLDDFGVVGAADAAVPGGVNPELAGGLADLDVRDLLRVFTVWRMKDRAGRIGAHGVGTLLRGLLADSAAHATPIHVVGHSFGARVCLSAIAHPPEVDLPRPVTSALLLQPAVNHLCFAADTGAGRPGGYRGVLARVTRPILSTFSGHDIPLTVAFHLALIRPRDLGEAEIAAGVPGEPPSRYAALGGFGPRGVGAGQRTVAIKDPGDPYDLAIAGLEIVAIEGTRTIHGHGDVASPSTAWAQRALIIG